MRAILMFAAWGAFLVLLVHFSPSCSAGSPRGPMIGDSFALAGCPAEIKR